MKTLILLVSLVTLLVSCDNSKYKNIDFADRIDIISYQSIHECDSTKNDEIFKIDPADPKCIQENITLDIKKRAEIKEILFEHAIKSSSCEVNDCYAPRHSVIYYKQNKRIAYVDICFECRQSRGENIGCLTYDRCCEIQSYFQTLGINYGLKNNCR